MMTMKMFLWLETLRINVGLSKPEIPVKGKNHSWEPIDHYEHQKWTQYLFVQ